ncbi:hypothetical protein [uncultured Prevotella sp.]|uniref:hypothetical protein n=1 Tax=uncultured Prevotella sp. TaxID=159272 RepID=UPI0027E23B34|nr:hypothetical protein [uncultured Prevotella sp.]
MALKQANTLAPSNVSATGFALADARHIGGHKVVASLTALYALQDWQLLNPGETDTALALGQQWYVKGIGFYRLTNWANRKTSSGWIKEVDPNNIDTTLFQIVSALPTSGINKNRIYLVASANRDPNGKNIYAEYIYTGDTSATYDATKWEKIGEYTPTVDLSPYMKLEQKGAANGVATLDANGKVTDNQLWNATSENHGLMSEEDKKILDTINDELYAGKYSDVCKFDDIFTPLIGDVEILQQSLSESVVNYAIIYLTTKNMFVASYEGKYYNNWAHKAETFGTSNTPVEGKLYLKKAEQISVAGSIASPTLYTGDSKGLYPLANQNDIQVMSNDEIDALFA